MFLRASLGASALLFAVPAIAQDASPTPDVSGNRVTVGIGVASIPDYEGSDDSRITPVPAIDASIGGFAFQVIGNRASVDLIPNRGGPGWDIQAGPMGVVNFNRASVKGIDDARIRALGKLDTALELGGYVGIGKTGLITSDYDKLSVSVSYRRDVLGVSDGTTITPSVTYFTPLSTKALVGLSAQANHVDGNYARTYFNVTPAGSLASGLPVFNARGGWKDVTLSAFAGHSLTGDLTGGLGVFGGVSWRKLMNDFSDSPITSIAGSNNQWSFALGLGYTF